ncbi:hypothetical protein EPO05_02890 [Patescibacteria group bacterium]|nr:MAG: hypothetical protein EPO05_02890 [Patescibacteria group bacterium]
MKKFLTKRSSIEMLFVVIAASLGIYLGWLWRDVAAFVVFIFIIVHPVPIKWLAIPTLILLVVTPIFLTLLKQEAIAEDLAVSAYYFLVMSVMMGIYELQGGENKRA